MECAGFYCGCNRVRSFGVAEWQPLLLAPHCGLSCTRLLANIPGMPNISAFRTVRVLRPLRSLTVVPEMQKLVMSLLGSIPALLNVVVLLMFVFAIFGILGVQLWSGLLHARCRTTAYPIKMIAGCEDTISDSCTAALATAESNGSIERCLDVPNDDDSWDHDSSPWNTRQACFWPVVRGDLRVCTLTGVGTHECPSSQYCGSDYDEFGNPRFMPTTMERTTYFAKYNWGYTNFDHIAVALLTIFQTITMEGWTDVMYLVSDAYNGVVAAVYFVFLILFGSFFLLNLTLAVIWDNFGGNKELEDLIQERRDSELADTLHAAAIAENANVSHPEGGSGANADRLAHSTASAVPESAASSPDAAAGTRHANASVAPAVSSDGDQAGGNHDGSQAGAGAGTAAAVVVVDGAQETPKEGDEEDGPAPHPCMPATKGACMHTVVTSKWFSAIIILLIIINTVVLASDHHPMDQDTASRLEVVNFVLTMMFTVEMVMKLYGLGFRVYVRDAFNVFDAFIVVVSLIETIVLPPGFLLGEEGGSGGAGAISALRTFRLFRVFKLARDWRSLNILLKTIVKTLADIANFAVVLLLFMYIFSLVGMQFFANTFCFHPDTGLPPAAGTPYTGSCPSGYDLPRAHFDDLLWAFVTVFQILTGENWNTVMYDGCRASGWTSVLYFVSLVVMGNFIVLNLFLAILLGNFEGMEALTAAGREEDANSTTPQPSTVQKLCAKLRLCKSKKVAPAESTVAAGSGMQGSVALSAAADGHPSSARSVHVRPKPQLAAQAVDMHAESKQPPAEEDEKAGASATGFSIVNDNGEPSPSQRGAAAAQQQQQERSQSKRGSAGAGIPTLQLPQDKQALPPLGAPGAMAGAGVPSSRSRKQLKPIGQHSSGMRPSTRQMMSESVREAKMKQTAPLEGRALWFFGPTNPLRVRIGVLVRHPLFDNTILALIFISSVLLAIDNPLLDPETFLVKFITVMDWIFTIAFTIEMVLKMVTYGFVLNGKDSYLRSGWNQLDFIIVIVSILSLAASGNDNLRSLRSLRTLRALRPLRVISRRPGLRLVVNALFSSIKAICNVLFVCVLFFLIFGIVGVNYFKGTFFACGGAAYDALPTTEPIVSPRAWNDMDGSGSNPEWQSLFPAAGASEYQANHATVAPTSKVACGYLGADWVSVVPQNFDNIFSAMGALFEMATTEGWVDIMYAGVDATEIDMQPVRDNGWGWTFFFMGFMVVGSFFVMNLFVGVVIDNFNTMKDRLGGNYLLTESQKEWVKTQERLMKNVPTKRRTPAPTTPVRAWCYRVTSSNYFEGFIMTCIILNTVIMSMTYFGETAPYSLALEIINYVFAVIFTVEAVLKLVALHRQYFKDSWNVFDFVIVLGTNIGLVLKLALNINIGPIATVVRTFRVGRIFRLIKSAKSLRQLFQTLILTLPSLGNVGGLLFLLFFIYAVMGVQLFSKVQLQDSLNHHANFQTFWLAVVTLMRASTGEAWNYIMYDLAEQAPGCNSDLSYTPGMCGFDDGEGCVPINGCGSSTAFPFFTSFTLFVTFVFLNLFIAVILEGFSESGDEAEAKVTDEHLQQFYEMWEEYDPNMTRFIRTQDMEALMQRLEEPMGFGASVTASKAQIQARLAALELPVYHGNVVFLKDVVKALVGRHFDESAVVPQDHKINKEWRKRFPSPRHQRQSGFHLHSYYAALSIQSSYVAEWVAARHPRVWYLPCCSFRSPGTMRTSSERASMLVLETKQKP